MTEGTARGRPHARGDPDRCAYVYCRAPLDAGDAPCPRCGFPREGTRAHEPERALGALPDGLPATLLDMHQIVVRQPQAWTLQLAMNERLGIEHLLLQAVPDAVHSLGGNRELRALRERHDNLTISQFCDPRLPFARRRLRRYARDGVRVIKLLPCLGYEPDRRAFDRFWAEMEAHGMVAMIHTGFITARHKAEERRAGVFLSSRFGRPIYLDRIARQFPGLTLILCHMGGASWHEEAAEMVTQHENVWGDVAGPGIAALRRLLARHVELDWSRVFWGNDSAPSCYGYNLRLLQGALAEAGRPELIEGLLRAHGRRFLDDVLDVPA